MKYIYRTQLSVYNNMKSTATVASRDNNSIEMTDIEDQEGARAGRHKVFGTKKKSYNLITSSDFSSSS